MKDYKIRLVKFTTTFVFDDRYDDADATDDEIIADAERQLADELEFGILSINDFKKHLIIKEYYDLDEDIE